MEEFWEVLRQACIFLVASKMILHFFPGKKYDRYGKMMVTLIVLSQLAVPILSFFREDVLAEFLDRADRLELENQMFSDRLEGLEQGQERLMENGVVLSVEEALKEPAAQAGVILRDVSVSEGVVVIEVTAEGFDTAQNGSQSSLDPAADGTPILVEQVEDIWVREEPEAARADASAVKGVRRTDLAESFAERLDMAEGQVEVIERR